MTNQLPIIIVNGQQGGSISPLDRGFAYGDGLFETCRISYGRVPLWALHKERLLVSCDAMKIDCDADLLQAYLHQLLALEACINLEDGVLKIIVTRGVAQTGRGYAIPAKAQTTYCFMLFSGNSLRTEAYVNGVDLCVCHHRLAGSSALAGLKHLNRLDQVIARAEWQSEFAEGLVFDSENNLIEATSSNVFLVRAGELVTPELSTAGVNGVMRRFVIEQLAKKMAIPVREARINLADLALADALFLTNSLMGIWPVKSVMLNNGVLLKFNLSELVAELQVLFEACLTDKS